MQRRGLQRRCGPRMRGSRAVHCHDRRWLRPSRSAAAVAVAVALSTAGLQAATPSFTRDIKPLLSERCIRCHGPDADERQGGGDEGLRLDTASGAAADLGGYAAVVPGRPDESETALPAHDHRPRPADAAPGRGPGLHRRRGGNAQRVDRCGGRLRAPLVVRAAGAAAPARGGRRLLGPHTDRSLRPRPPRRRGHRPSAAGQPCGVCSPDWPST